MAARLRWTSAAANELAPGHRVAIDGHFREVVGVTVLPAPHGYSQRAIVRYRDQHGRIVWRKVRADAACRIAR